MLALLVLCVSAVVLGEEISSSSGEFEKAAATSGCTLSRSSVPTYPPLLSNRTKVIYPGYNDNGDISIPIGSQFTAGCTPGDNKLQTYQANQVDVECRTGGKLFISSSIQSTSYSQLGCSDPLKEEIYTRGTCYNNYQNISIEFDYATTQFPLITICHDDTLFNTVMSQHSLYGASISSAETSNARPSFKKAQYYSNISPQTAYTQKQQLDMVKSLVKSSTLADTYINKDNFFARGHLSPDGDFIYVREQNATYYFVNVVPQWQSINNGNWKALEMAARNLAANKGTSLNIFTGGYDVLKLKDTNGTLVDIYLAKNGNQYVLPAPRLTWKIIHDPSKKAAVVVIMVNNPHDQGITSADIICKDICDQVTWVKWDRTNIRKGYTYCCTPSDFRSKVKYAPNLGRTKLLDS